MVPTRFEKPAVGIGFRKEASSLILASLDELDVLEVTVDHYISGTASFRRILRDVCRRVPVVAHGVGLSVGTAVLPDERYLRCVAEFMEMSGSPWYSEHLAFSKVPELDLAQLIPVPRTRAMLDVLVENVAVVKKHIHAPFLLENITYYFDYPNPEYTEPEFLNAVLSATGSRLLLDVENLFINSVNHGYDAVDYIRSLPKGIVGAVHLAGGTKQGELLVDSHDMPVPEEVFGLLRLVLQNQEPDTITIERDQDLGPAAFEMLLNDVRSVRAIVESVEGKVANVTSTNH